MFYGDAKSVVREMVENKMPVAMWGPSGAGKSSMVKEIAEDMTAEYKQEVGMIDIRLSQIEPTDLRGILVADVPNKKGIWLPPSMLPTDPDWVGIIMLDEISSAPPMVQSAAYQLILDRKLGEYVLPEGAALVAAGNRDSDKGTYFRLAAPLANRFASHIELEVSLAEWKKWAYRVGIDASILGYLSFNPEALHKFDGASKEKGFPTPRSWESSSKVLKFNLSERIMKETILGGVGSGIGNDFWAYREILHGVVETATILDMNKDYELPNDISASYAINASIIHHLKDRKLLEEEVLAVYRYLNKIPQDEVRVASFREFTGIKLPIIGGKTDKAKKAFEDFFQPIKHLIPTS